MVDQQQPRGNYTKRILTKVKNMEPQVRWSFNQKRKTDSGTILPNDMEISIWLLN